MMPDTQQILNKWKLAIFICSLIHPSIHPAHSQSHHVLSCVPVAHRLVVRLKQGLQEGHQLGFLGTEEGQAAKGIRAGLLGEVAPELKNAVS